MKKNLIFDLATVAGSSGWNVPDFLPRLPAAKVAWMHVAGSWEMKKGQRSQEMSGIVIILDPVFSGELEGF